MNLFPILLAKASRLSVGFHFVPLKPQRGAIFSISEMFFPPLHSNTNHILHLHHLFHFQLIYDLEIASINSDYTTISFWLTP